jgi:maltose alpha-D-glucosyltransferase / alpha-amylase
MHAILARDTNDPSFAPEMSGIDTAEQWAAQAEQQLAAAFAALDAQKEWDEAAARDLAAVNSVRERLVETVQELARSGSGSTLTRIHGDLHLGQVLVANGDVYIIDFEGEPAKPMALRRAKNNRLRDVAGMIRSFDYAAAVVKRKSLASHAHVADPSRDAFLRSFVERGTQCFLNGYLDAFPSTDVTAEKNLLQLFLLEKAGYEIAYEAANRPSWIDVPLHGMAQLVTHLVGEQVPS